MLIWVYYWLLILEGVMRKWVFPAQSDLIFVIRDPVVVLIYLLALRAQVFPLRPAVMLLGVMALLSVVFAITTNTPVQVVLFGLHADFLHLPFVFIVAATMNRDDVIKIGKWTLILSVPILLLMMRQFSAAPDDPINASAGGYVGGQLRGALGKIRPPGPFSFITGPVAFYGLVAAFVFHGWAEPGKYPRLLVLAATAATVAAVPVSISRSLLLSVLIVIAFGVVAAIRDIRRIPRFIGPLVVVASVAALAADSEYVQVFQVRWDEAASAGNAGTYQNVIGRMTSMFTEPFSMAMEVPIFGSGIGLGTLAGARLMTGAFTFLLSESELLRNIMELGPVLGTAFILWRVWLAAMLLLTGWRVVLARGDPLPWLIAGASFFNVLIGQWGQTTMLGFSVLGAGLSLAAANEPEEAPAEDEAAESAAGAVAPREGAHH